MSCGDRLDDLTLDMNPQKENSAASKQAGRGQRPHRLVEALYDVQAGKTFVRHPFKKGEWIERDLLSDLLKGYPAASVSGEESYEIFPTVPHRDDLEETTESEAPKLMTFVLHQQGRNNLVNG